MIHIYRIYLRISPNEKKCCKNWVKFLCFVFSATFLLVLKHRNHEYEEKYVYPLLSRIGENFDHFLSKISQLICEFIGKLEQNKTWVRFSKIKKFAVKSKEILVLKKRDSMVKMSHTRNLRRRHYNKLSQV